jgi:toxin ParE1/3/4
VRYLSLEVVIEFDEAIATYEAQRPDRGVRFRAAVQAVYRRIQAAPLSFPRSRILDRPVLRRAKVQRFPYSIFFYMLRGEPILIAVAHGKREPGYWHRRLRS